MDPLTLSIASAALSAFDGPVRSIVEAAIESLSRKTPIRREKDNSVVLEPPSNRLGMGMKLLDGKQVLAIYLEKGEGPAYNEALELQKREP